MGFSIACKLKGLFELDFCNAGNDIETNLYLRNVLTVVLKCCWVSEIIVELNAKVNNIIYWLTRNNLAKRYSFSKQLTSRLVAQTSCNFALASEGLVQ